MLLIEKFPPGYVTPAPDGFCYCVVRGCAARLHLPHGAGLCPAHDDVTPGDLRRDVPVQTLFPWR